MPNQFDKATIEHHLRRLSVDKLRLLKVFTGEDRYISTPTIAGNAHTVERQATGGKVSSLIRTKINDQPMFLLAGKQNRQSRLELNKEVINKQTLKEILDKIGI